MKRFWMCALGMVLVTPALAYKSSFAAIHFGTSVGASYADQLPMNAGGWDPVSKVIGASDTYVNASAYKTPLRLGFFYRHPNFTVDGYLKYFTNYSSAFVISGAHAGAGNSRYKGIGGGVDFEMPFVSGPWLRAGFMLNAEYQANHVVTVFNPDASATTESLDAKSSSVIFGAGAFMDTYVGDLWSVGMRGLYGYDLGGHWTAGKSSTFLGTTYSAGSAINNPEGDPTASNFSHWRAEAVLRLAFY